MSCRAASPAKLWGELGEHQWDRGRAPSLWIPFSFTIFHWTNDRLEAPNSPETLMRRKGTKHLMYLRAKETFIWHMPDEPFDSVKLHVDVRLKSVSSKIQVSVVFLCEWIVKASLLHLKRTR